MVRLHRIDNPLLPTFYFESPLSEGISQHWVEVQGDAFCCLFSWRRAILRSHKYAHHGSIGLATIHMTTAENRCSTPIRRKSQLHSSLFSKTRNTWRFIPSNSSIVRSAPCYASNWKHYTSCKSLTDGRLAYFVDGADWHPSQVMGIKCPLWPAHVRMWARPSNFKLVTLVFNTPMAE